jgi:carbon-monoxide dehydrogenase large subunit
VIHAGPGRLYQYLHHRDYRGAGRPEAAYLIERMIDIAAGRTGKDRVELRRINCIPADAMPYQTGLTFRYDSGNFGRNLEDALELADYAGFEARRVQSARHGKLRGIGVTNTTERSSPPLPEAAEIRFDPTGSLSVLVGTKSRPGRDTCARSWSRCSGWIRAT